MPTHAFAQITGDERSDERPDVDSHVENREARIASRSALGIKLADDRRDVRLEQPGADDDENEAEEKRLVREQDRQRDGDVAERDEHAAVPDGALKAQPPVGDPAAGERRQVDRRRVDPDDRRRRGAVERETAAGQGATFRLVFPVREAPSTEISGGSVVSPSLPPLRILFVDDEPLLRELVKDILEFEGHFVEVADGGQAGVDAFRAARKRDQPFDVVVTDLGMPRLDGRQLTQILKSESPLTPILMMTGWGTLIKGEDLPAQVDGMLNKPPNIGELLEALRKVTQSRA